MTGSGGGKGGRKSEGGTGKEREKERDGKGREGKAREGGERERRKKGRGECGGGGPAVPVHDCSLWHSFTSASWSDGVRELVNYVSPGPPAPPVAPLWLLLLLPFQRHSAGT